MKDKVENDKRTNIYDIGEKLQAKKPRTLSLKDFKQAKIGKRRFDNEPPTKECVA